MTAEQDDWTEYDAVNVLALPLHRWTLLKDYRLPDGGFDGAVRRVVYANGTEHGFGQERAETVLELGPMLRRVLLAGIRACMANPASDLESYVGAVTAGDHEQIVAIERRVEAMG